MEALDGATRQFSLVVVVHLVHMFNAELHCPMPHAFFNDPVKHNLSESLEIVPGLNRGDAQQVTLLASLPISTRLPDFLHQLKASTSYDNACSCGTQASRLQNL